MASLIDFIQQFIKEIVLFIGILFLISLTSTGKKKSVTGATIKPITGKQLLSLGIPLLLLAAAGYFFGMRGQAEPAIWGIAFLLIGFPFGLLFTSLGLAKLYVEPAPSDEIAVNLTPLSTDKPQELLLTNHPRASIALMYFTIMLGLLLFVFHMPLWVSWFFLPVFVLMAYLKLSYRYIHFLVYPDRFILEGFSIFFRKFREEIPAASISSIQKTYFVPWIFSNPSTFKITNFGLVDSIRETVVGKTSQDAFGASLLIKTKMGETYLFPGILAPDKVVTALQTLIATQK